MRTRKEKQKELDRLNRDIQRINDFEDTDRELKMLLMAKSDEKKEDDIDHEHTEHSVAGDLVHDYRLCDGIRVWSSEDENDLQSDAGETD